MRLLNAAQRESIVAKIEIGKITEVPPGASKTFVKHGKRILVTNLAGVIVSYENLCPHMGGVLRAGGGEKKYTCSWHGATFDVATGCAINDVAHGTTLKKMTVTVEGDALMWEPGEERSPWADD
ncbi:MAG: 3-phenylpropionate/cinnamic acid dioxygenase ferredoxin subunit, partial [Candidatus Parcubacteria bacterium]